MFDLLILNGCVVTPSGAVRQNVAIKDGKIAALLDSGVIPEAAECIDAAGKYVFPGAVDTHAHLNDPGYCWREDYEHGTKAAAVGGYTTVIDMPLQNEPAMTTAEIMNTKLDCVSKNAYVDFCLWGGLVPSNFGDLKGLWDNGVVAFKSFIGPVSPDYATLSYGEALDAMKIIAGFGGKAGFHCEDPSIIRYNEAKLKREGRTDWRSFLDSRPVSAETTATYAIIEAARETGCDAHICHVSCPEAAELVKQAQAAGIKITAETCSHYLTFTEDDVIKNGALFKCAPPLRPGQDVEKLWGYVKDRVFSGIASDHSPCTYDEKFNELLGSKIETPFDVWGGISGIQSGFMAAFSEGCVKRGIAPETLAYALSESPARAFGIWGRKGAIATGFDADIVIIDPDAEWEIKAEDLQYVNKISAFIGLKGKGLPILTLVRGRKAAENGKPSDTPCGAFVRRV